MPSYRRRIQGRGDRLLCILMGLFVLLSLRLGQIHVLKHDEMVARAEKIREHQLPLNAHRGTIRDRCGRELAISVEAAGIYLQPRYIQDREATFRQVASLTGIPAYRISRKCEGGDFTYLWRQAPAEVGDRIRKAGIRGVGCLRESQRLYPSGALAAQIIGFTDIDGVGIEGMERAAERYLKAQNGYVVAEVDPGGVIIPDTKKNRRPPSDGSEVVLTIDSIIQSIAEEALEKTCKIYRPDGACAIVMDTRTGEILAIANYPAPSGPGDRRDPARWRNRAITDLYEPGSTLKTITMAAAFEEGMSSHKALSYCTGRLRVGGRTIRCVLHRPYLHGHGDADMYRTIEQSCNVAAASTALKLGARTLYRYEKAFGFTEKPGSGLPGEAWRELEKPEDWARIKLANVGFGQGISVTPLHMVTAYAAIANGGVLMRPQIIREIRRPDGTPLRRFRPIRVRRVVSAPTAGEVTRMLVGCVENGTGKNAAVEGYLVAGKTGSAQRAVNGSYSGIVASFIGFLPAYDPRIAIAVVV